MSPIGRACRVLGRPKAEWVAIAAERPLPRSLLLQLVLPLGLLGALATLFAPMILAGGTAGFPAVRWIVTAVFVSLVIPAAMIGAAAYAAHGFATSVGAERDWARGFALAAFAATPYLLMPVVRALVPSLLGVLIGLVAMASAVALVHLGVRAVAQYVGYGLLRLVMAMS